jgi:uncharacterized protein
MLDAGRGARLRPGQSGSFFEKPVAGQRNACAESAMNGTWTALHTIPRTGKTFVFNDQSLWRGPLDEFGIPCTITETVTAEIFVLPLDEGVLFRGRITGGVALPCDRCADDARVTLDHAFDDFEPYPAGIKLPLPDEVKEPGSRQRPAPRRAGGRKGPDGKNTEAPAADRLADTDETVVRIAPHGREVEINPAALAWEEFSLALPVKPLCKENCRGLCPVCGRNRNLESCACDAEKTDARLTALRAFKTKH